MLENTRRHAALVAVLLGIVVSGLWYVVGAEDRALVEEYRRRAGRSAERVAQAAGRGWFAEEHAGERVGEVRDGFFSWYRPAISVTKLPAIVGFGLLCLWVLLLAAWIAAFVAGWMPEAAPAPGPRG